MKTSRYAVQILLSEVMYDLNLITWKKSSLLDVPEKEKNKVILEDKDSMFVARQVEMAIANILSRLSWCTRHHYHVQTDEIRKVEDCWDIAFYFTPEWRGNIRSIKDYIHKYIVEYTLAEWYRLVSPADVADAMTSAEQWLYRAQMEARSVKFDIPVRFNL